MPCVAIYARTSVDKIKTIEHQLLQLNDVAQRFGWTIVWVNTDEGILGTKGRDRRPAFDKLIRTMVISDTGIRETALRTGVEMTSITSCEQTLTANAA